MAVVFVPNNGILVPNVKHTFNPDQDYTKTAWTFGLKGEKFVVLVPTGRTAGIQLVSRFLAEVTNLLIEDWTARKSPHYPRADLTLRLNRDKRLINTLEQPGWYPIFTWTDVQLGEALYVPSDSLILNYCEHSHPYQTVVSQLLQKANRYPLN